MVDAPGLLRFLNCLNILCNYDLFVVKELKFHDAYEKNSIFFTFWQIALEEI